ncbi:hypothetical protein ACTXT7_017557 [Hymenolepis weldensis]
MEENNGDELAATSKRKQELRQRSVDSFNHYEFVRRVHGMAWHGMAWYGIAQHGMMDENSRKSMHNILPNIFKRLKEQQYIKYVVHQHLGFKSYVLRRGHQFMWTVSADADADADAYVETLQTIVVMPPRIDNTVNGGRHYIFQRNSPPSH